MFMDQMSAATSTPGLGGRITHRLLTRSPLGLLVRWVARIQASVHAKLLGGFLLVTLLFIAMGVLSLQTIARMSHQSQLLHEAHERVDSSRQIEHALAMQMNFIAMALLLKDEGTIANFLRENNRFNDMLARLEEAARRKGAKMIQQIRTAQDDILTTVADIANFIRDGKVDEAMTLQLKNGYPQYQQIDRLVNQVVKTEEDKMATLRRIVPCLEGPAPHGWFRGDLDPAGPAPGVRDLVVIHLAGAGGARVPRPGGARGTSARLSTCRIGTNWRPGRSHEPDEPGTAPLDTDQRQAASNSRRSTKSWSAPARPNRTFSPA